MKNQTFSPSQIDTAIEKGERLKYLYANPNTKFSPSNIEKAIEKGEWLNFLYSKQKLSIEQKKKLEERIEIKNFFSKFM